MKRNDLDKKGRQYKPANTNHRGRKVNKRKFARSVIIMAGIAVCVLMAVHFFGCPIGEPEAEMSMRPSAAAENPLNGKWIVLDAGHGGFDVGAIGVSGAYEDDMNLTVASFLREDLQSAGAHVIMTREDGEAIANSKDEDMQARRRIIEESGSDIVVSIHMNIAEDPDICGPLVLFMPGSVQGEALAKTIQASMIKELEPSNENCARSEEMYIIESGSQPCVIVECGFISNADEEEMLLDTHYQQRVAQAITDGCAEYFDALAQ